MTVLRPRCPFASLGPRGGERVTPSASGMAQAWSRSVLAIAVAVLVVACAQAPARHDVAPIVPPPVRTDAPLPRLPALTGAASRIDLPRADGETISAHWFPRAVAAGSSASAAASPQPAVVALHGCGGLWRRDGVTFDARYVEYLQRLHAAGFHVLLPDSFSARGVATICTDRYALRKVDVERRRGDVAAAVRWLALRADVDARRIVVLGWSHGGSTTLAALDGARGDAVQPVAGAIVFYPGCYAQLQRGFEARQPLLMLLGASDDWTPPERCTRLVERTRAAQPAADITLRVYADSYHGFDGRSPVRLWAEVPNGVNQGGVHLGANPAARAAAHAEVDLFLQRIRQ